MTEIRNLFFIDKATVADHELFDTLIKTPEILIERIISSGQVSPEGFWYDQPADEWVALLQGSAALEMEGSETAILNLGDFLFIPAHCRHRVGYTSIDPPCIWLAIHGRLKGD